MNWETATNDQILAEAKRRFNAEDPMELLLGHGEYDPLLNGIASSTKPHGKTNTILHMNAPNWYEPGDILRLIETGENVRVIERRPGSLKVERGYGGTRPTAFTCSAIVQVGPPPEHRVS